MVILREFVRIRARRACQWNASAARLAAKLAKWRNSGMGNHNSDILAADIATPRAETPASLLSPRILSAIVALLLGAGILFVAGFSSNDFVHAAAHDVRHASGFPCH